MSEWAFQFLLLKKCNGMLFSPPWQGETGANVLVGIQVPDSEIGEFQGRADNLGYEYEIEMNNKAFRLLMR